MVLVALDSTSNSFNWSGRTQFLELCPRCIVFWKMVVVTKAKNPPHVFVENLVHLAKPWSRTFLHLMAQKGSWFRVGHHCHISKQNKKKNMWGLATTLRKTESAFATFGRILFGMFRGSGAALGMATGRGGDGFRYPIPIPA